MVDIDEIENKDDVEFLVGVGVASKANSLAIAEIGYGVIDQKDLIADLLHNNKNYDATQILQRVIVSQLRFSKNLPVFKYLKEIGIDSQDKYDKSGLNISKCVNRDIKEFKARTYTKSHFKNYRHMSIQEIIDACTPENSAAHIPFLPKDKIDLEILKDFLIVNENKLDSAVSSYASSFRKLAAYYDRLKYGW